MQMFNRRKIVSWRGVLPLQCQLDVEGDGGAGVNVKDVEHVASRIDALRRHNDKGRNC